MRLEVRDTFKCMVHAAYLTIQCLHILVRDTFKCMIHVENII